MALCAKFGARCQQGETLPAVPEPGKREYPRAARTAEHAAAIPCRQVLSAYAVSFER